MIKNLEAEEIMETVGVIGLGDMGSGLAKNLMTAGYETYGFDVNVVRLDAFAAAGGHPVHSAAAVASAATTVFVMVMTGEQAKAAILGDGLISTMRPGGTIVLTATIRPSEAMDIGLALEGSGINLVDSPVSGGFAGAQGGALTMMAAGTDVALARAHPAMAAVSSTIHHVGAEIGMGQTVKACLQSLT
ncbi:MAG: NAD(P)-dependent oxidoreductase, partial [Hyphomicrobiaceae bacterium]